MLINKNNLLREGKIGVQETIFVASLAAICKAAFVKNQFSIIAGNTLYQGSLIQGAIICIIFALGLLMMKNTKTDNLIDAMLISLGKVFGSLSLLAICLCLVYCVVEVTSKFATLLSSYIFVDMQSNSILLLIMLVVMPIAWMGFEAISRTGKIFALILAITFITMFLGVTKWFDVSNLFPIWGNGIMSTIEYGISGSLYFVDILVILLLGKAMQSIKFAKKSGFSAIAISTLVVFGLFLTASLMFPYKTIYTMLSPIYRIATTMKFGNDYVRLDELIVCLWFACAAVSAAFSIYGASNIYCKVFKIEDIRSIIPAISIFAYCAATLNLYKHEAFVSFDWFMVRFGILLIALPILAATAISFFRKGKSYEKSL